VIHRDVAPRNFLVGPDGLVICDFGLSLLLPEGKDFGFAPVTDSIPVGATAPEALARGIYSRQTDVYMFGIFMWELFLSKAGDSGSEIKMPSAEEVIHESKRPSIPDGMPEGLREIMVSAWSQDSKLRPQMEVINRDLKSFLKFSPVSTTSQLLGARG